MDSMNERYAPSFACAYASPPTSQFYDQTPSPQCSYDSDGCFSYDNDSMHICPFNIDTCTGCTRWPTAGSDYGSQRSSQSSRTSPRLRMADEEFLPISRAMTPARSITSFTSPAADRMQMKEEFLKLYFPAGLFETDFMYSSFLSREMLEGKGSTMDAAIDALCLVHMGTAHFDQRLIREAQKRYNAAVANVNLDVANPNAGFDEDILGASYLLGFCELFQPLSLHTQSWRFHHKQLRDALLSRGPDGPYSKFGQLIVYNMRHIAAIVAGETRTKSSFESLGWKSCSALTDGYMAALSELVIRVPNALENADSVMSRPRPEVSELFGALAELAELERRTQAWLLNWYRSFSRLPYWTEHSQKFPRFQHHCASHPDVFPKMLRFPSFSHASAQACYWIASLQLKQATFEMNRRYSLPSLPKPEAILASEANECADRLCESVAYLTQSCYGSCGILHASTLLHHAARWYATVGRSAKARWCASVRESLQRTGHITSLL